MSYDPTLFNVDPYYDDFSESKKFLRLLFRPGFAVQARELTQMQTILQNQVERFGNHVFDDGSIVYDGQIFEDTVKFVRVTGLSGTTDVKDFIGTYINSPGRASGRVIYAENGLSGSSLDTSSILYFQYASGASGYTAGNVLSATANSELIQATITALTGHPTSYLGDAILVSTNQGVRYVDGYFVSADSQKIGLYDEVGATGSKRRDFSAPTVRVGYNVTKSIVTEDMDSSLTDPAFGSFNYNAPGAHRFKIDLAISQYPFTPTNTSAVDNFSRKDFLEFLRVSAGSVIKKEIYSDYGPLEDTFARRTYDESGNYLVRPFQIYLSEGPSADKLNVNIEPGKAYVYGYEFETQGTTKITVDKPRDASSLVSVDNRFFNRNFGPYSLLTLYGGTAALGEYYSNKESPQFILSSSTGASGPVAIGTARVRNIIFESGNDYRVYLYDINITGSTRTFDAVKSIYRIGNFAAGRQTFQVASGVTAHLYDGANNNLIYEAPVGNTLKTVTDFDFNVFTEYKIDFASGLTFTKLPTYNNFSLQSSIGSIPNPSLFVVDQNGVSKTGSYSLSGSSLTVVLGSPGTTLAYMFTEENVNNTTVKRIKNAVKETISLTGQATVLLTDSNNNKFLYLQNNVDVFAIDSITGDSGSGLTNMTNWFTLDPNQTDSYYDYSKIILKPEYNSYIPTITGPFEVVSHRFSHSGFGPIFVDSYVAGTTTSRFNGYNDIPTYTSTSTGKVYNLRDCIDFRPYKMTLTGALTGCYMPTNDTDNNIDYQYYIPRIDKLILTRGRELKVVSGISSIEPSVPDDNPDAMSLATIRLNPFTFSPTDASVRLLGNKRYTMKEIGDIEKRVDRLEYYTTLSLLEMDAKNTRIWDDADPTLELTKSGILVDSFKGHNIGNTKDKEYSISMDFINSELRPKFQNCSFKLIPDTFNAPSGVTYTSDNIAILEYTNVVAINQPLSNTTVNVNPFGVTNYLGSVKFSPSSLSWYDDNNKPLTKVNVDGENDAWLSSYVPYTGATAGLNYGFGTQWKDWELNWYGTEIDSNSYFTSENIISQGSINTQDNNSYNSITNRLVPESIKSTYDNKYVDKSIVPYIKDQTITINVEGLKPLTTHYAFFDNFNVSAFCTGSLVSDASGKLTNIQFGVPVNTFLSGERLFRFIDNESNDVSTASSCAENTFYCSGLIPQKSDSGIVSIRPAIVRRDSVNTDYISNSVFSRYRLRSSSSGYLDPLSQTFIVNGSTYPSGMFVSKISLFFSQKETDSTIPVCIQIRPLVNGFPHPSKIVPLSEKYLYPSDITASSTPTATDFNFSTPVYLTPGEYAIVVTTNSDKYVLHMAQEGQIQTGTTDQRISVGSEVGSLFKPQNGQQYEMNTTEDIAFVVYRANFTNSSGNFRIVTDPTSDYASSPDVIYVNAVYNNINSLIPSNTTVICGALTTPSSNAYIEPNKTMILDVPTSYAAGVDTDYVSVYFTGNSQVSPCVDLDRTREHWIQNIIQSVGPTGPHTSTSSSNSQYVSKNVILGNGFSATNLHVYLNAYNPSDAEIQVWAKYLPQGNTSPMENRNWEKLDIVTNRTSNNEKDYKEIQYRFSTDVEEFTVFAIKIMLLSDVSNSRVPVIRNARILATV